VICLLIGLFLQYDQYTSYARTSYEAAAWDRVHMRPALEATAKSADGPPPIVRTVSGLPPAAYAEQRPYIVGSDDGGPFFVGLIAGILCLLAGRGIRYVFANE
jgi:hypothetical protein